MHLGSSPRCPPPSARAAALFFVRSSSPFADLWPKTRSSCDSATEMLKASLLVLLFAAGCHRDPEGTPTASHAAPSAPLVPSAIASSASSQTAAVRARAAHVSLDGVLHDATVAPDTAATR